MDLKTLRQQIDQIDDQLLNLLRGGWKTLKKLPPIKFKWGRFPPLPK